MFYYPYKSDKPNKKFYIITSKNKKVYFGQASASDFTIHKDEVRKLRYIMRHQKNENWNDFNTAGAWSRFLLWEEPNIKDAYKKIKEKLLKNKLITKEQYNQYVF
jgi:hypothetical protein